MNKILFLFFSLASCLSYANPIGETAAYTLNHDTDRTSWLITEGEGVGTVEELLNDATIGPAYLVRIEYSFDVIFVGQKQGSIGLLVPIAMFDEQFYNELKISHPKDVGSFDVDYLGMGSADDGENNSYDQCLHLKIFNVDPSYNPVPRSNSISILWHDSVGTLGSIENIVLNIKRHEDVPVLGAVQIDMSGRARGIDVKAGLDFLPGE